MSKSSTIISIIQIDVFIAILLFPFPFHSLFVNDTESIFVSLGIQLSHKTRKDSNMDQGSPSIYNTQYKVS